MGREASRDHSEPLCRLIRFEATDGVQLSGLLYEPRRKSTKAAVFLHGTGGASIFDSQRTSELAAGLLERGIAWFPFDNRGSQLVRRLRVRRGRSRRSMPGGSAHELIREAVFDIDGAARFLRRRGYRELFLVGHSTGANKIAVYNLRKPRNPFRRFVLLAGGDDTGGLYASLGRRRFATTLEKARSMVRDRRGSELAPARLSPVPMSWRSLQDMLNPDGDYNVFPFLEVMCGLRFGRKQRFRHVRSIRKPALFVYGDSDEYCYGDVPRCVAILSDALGAATNCELVIMEDANHGFSGKEPELAALMADWLLT